MSTETATVKLFFDAEKTKLVLEGDPEARILAAAPGDPIPEGFKVPGAKAAAKVEDKQSAAPANKGGVTIVKEDAPAKPAK